MQYHMITLFDSFFGEERQENIIRWLERSSSNIVLVRANLDVAGYLKQVLFELYSYHW